VAKRGFNVPTGLFLIALTSLAAFLPTPARAQAPTYLTQWGSRGSGDGQFNDPAGVATDAAGDVSVAVAGNPRIPKFASTGTYLTQWGSQSSGSGQPNTPSTRRSTPQAMSTSRTTCNCIKKFTGTGTYLTQWFAGQRQRAIQRSHGSGDRLAGDVYVAEY
jgi:hypothetical protein